MRACDESKIVVYFSDGDITNATRALFALNWAGLGDQSYLLDGGLEAWERSGGTLSTEEPVVQRGSLTLKPRRDLIVDADWVQARASADGFRVLDARSRAFFEGVQRSRGRAGHIPGSGSLPWTELVDYELKLKDKDALRARFAQAGVDPGDVVVAYCHIGQYATAVLLAARILGHEVRLYDGAFEDWALRDLPVVAGAH